ncbi:MAG: sel1 repeat family protein [Hyphomicrobiaceae bacterium]|nr:sel1 repeat family protein [Hyphomicrobiaceae bacterium]
MSRSLRLPARILGSLAALMMLAGPALAVDPETPETPADAPEAAPAPFAAPETTTSTDPFEAYRFGFYVTAMNRALERAEQGDAAAMALIGRLFLEGRGVTLNRTRAMEWFALAADAGDPRAAFEWARLALEDDNAENDRDAVPRLEQAVADGNARAEIALAFVLIEGQLAPRDLTRAAELMTRASDAGIAEAQYALALMYREGAGLVPNDVEATRLLGLAAEQGHVEAQVEYAFAIFQGRGVARNEAVGAAWFERAAHSGNAIAQNRVARMHATGTVLAFDPLLAATWHFRAVEQGLQDARLDTFIAGLPEEVVAEARTRARAPLDADTDPLPPTE